ncbi:MAG: hypothetical protein IAF02_04670 [Anaerolineae bacterium]|nr:hypothetical protein [Anaerolineae bacterium]
MNEQINLLKAEIYDSLEAIAAAYSKLNEISQQEYDEDTCILIAYHLHVIYGLFENIFTRIAANFGNHLDDSTQWHTLLLKRMSMEIPNTRPAVISQNTYLVLDELRRFRHLFRNAYVLKFDPDRIRLIVRDAFRLETLYPDDVALFQRFLDLIAE